MSRLHRDERGLSLIELLLTMTILAGVGGMLLSSMVTAERATKAADARVEDLGHAQVAIGAVSRSLRAAVTPTGEPAAFVAATPSRVAFYSNIGVAPGDAPSYVVVEAVTTAAGTPALRETIEPGRYEEVTVGGVDVVRWQSDGPARERLLARGLAPDADRGLALDDVFFFHPRTDPGDSFTPDPTDTASLRQIGAVTVDLRVQGRDVAGVSASQLRNRVRLANL